MKPFDHTVRLGVICRGHYVSDTPVPKELSEDLGRELTSSVRRYDFRDSVHRDPSMCQGVNHRLCVYIRYGYRHRPSGKAIDDRQ